MTIENGLHPCQRRPHYGEPCDCEARLAQVFTHTRTSTGGYGPDFCAECSQAINEWVPWPCEATRVLPPAEGRP